MEGLEVPEEEKVRVPRGKRVIQLIFRLGLIGLLLGVGGYLVWRGGWPGVLFWLLMIIFLIEHSVGILFALYDEPGSRRHGFLFWISSVFLGSLAVQMVRQKDLEVKTVRPAGPLAPLFARLGAPAIVVIENGLAAVFERSGKFTRVHGPGIVYTRRFERVAHVIDLRPQLRQAEIKDIQTRDGLKFDIKPLYALFQVATEYPQRADYGYSEQAILDLIYRGGLLYNEKGEPVEWGRRVLGVIEYHLRRVAAQHDLLELVQGDSNKNARENFRQEVTEAARADLQQCGVRLVGIDMGEVGMPDEIHALLALPIRQKVDIGWAQTQRDAVIGISEGLRKAMGQIKKAIPQDTGQKSLLLLNLMSTLGAILEKFLQLARPYYHEGPERLEKPEGRPAIGPGETGTGEGGKKAGG